MGKGGARPFQRLWLEWGGEKVRSVEAPGIDPGTSRMLSERFTI